jgi:acetyl-CoA hydrolase
MSTAVPLAAGTVSSRFDFRAVLRPGDTVAWPQGSGEPLGLTQRLVAQRRELPPIRLFFGMSSSRTLTPEVAESFAMTALNGAGANRRLTAGGVADILPVHVSTVPALLRSGAVRVDVALIRVRPHPRPGWMTLGVIADYTAALVQSARVVIAELDERLPVTAQDALIPAGAIHHLLTCDAEAILMPDPEPSAAEVGVARNVAALIPDGATVQLGVGTLPVAVGRALLGHRDLGIHSGVVSDVFVDMVERGAVTNARKGIDAGISVCGGLFGSRRLLDHADGNPAVAMRSVEYTHNPAVMARLHALHAVNSAVEVDLTGQVNSEEAGGRYLGAIGGQVDFVRGAQASPGGRAILALPSTTPDGKVSRIVRSLGGRPVTTARSDVDLVVTEWGVAELRGCTLGERARRLAAIAHPDFRDALHASAAAPAGAA